MELGGEIAGEIAFEIAGEIERWIEREFVASVSNGNVVAEDGGSLAGGGVACPVPLGLAHGRHSLEVCTHLPRAPSRLAHPLPFLRGPLHTPASPGTAPALRQPCPARPSPTFLRLLPSAGVAGRCPLQY